MDFAGPEEHNHDMDALANDGIVLQLKEELARVAKRFGFSSMMITALQPTACEQHGPGTARFYVVHGDIYAVYGAIRVWVDCFKAEKVNQHLMIRLGPPPMPPKEDQF